MALFLLFGLILPTVFLLYILIIDRSKSFNIKGNHPAGKLGWPIIGESLDFASNPERFIHDRMTKHSLEIFQTSIAGESMAVLCGPAGNKAVFSSSDKLLKPWWPKSITKALLFESSYQSPLLEDHQFLQLDSIQNYVSIMDSATKDHLKAKWVPFSEVKVYPLAKEFTFTLACKIFINYCDDQVKDLAKLFMAVMRGIVSTPVNLPGTDFSVAVKGGAVIKQKVVALIRQRKEEIAKREGDVSKSRDLLSRLLLACDKVYSEEEIANKIIGYLVASFYTTSSAITFVLSHLADHPHVYEQVLHEQQNIAKPKDEGELLNWADVQKMRYSWNVVCESMRLIAPAHGGFKEVLSDFSFAGFRVPKGWKAFWTVHSTNKNPKYFPDPEKFDPSRFEGNGPPPFTYVPFGGGPRMCAGKEYARIEVLVFVHNVVTKFKLQKVNPSEKVIYKPEALPVEGLPIYLKPHIF